jgi:Mg-chelatase subunit ChlD
VAFSDTAVVLKAQDERRPVEQVVDALLALRGHGTTDLALALDVAGRQLARSRAARSTTVLLTDGRPTAGADPLPAARRLDALVVLAPADDSEQARELATAAGARFATLRGPVRRPAGPRAARRGVTVPSDRVEPVGSGPLGSP